MIEKLNDISWIITIIQIVMGGLIFSIFRLWLLKEEELRKTISLRKERRIEEVCIALKNIFHRALNEEIPLRGDGGEYPDIILEFSKKTVQTSNDFYWYKKCQNSITYLINYLILTSFIGAVFLILTFILDNNTFLVGITAVILILSQIVVFFIIRSKNSKLNRFEDL